jgi:hypothetical protein
MMAHTLIPNIREAKIRRVLDPAMLGKNLARPPSPPINQAWHTLVPQLLGSYK